MSRVENKTAVAALAALAQDTRLAIYRLLVERGPEGMSAGRIAEALSLPDSSLSFHLAQLNRAGLIAQKRMSRQLIYSTDFAAMNDLVGYLTENCCGGNPALCAPACEPSCAPIVSSPKNKRKSA